MGRSAGRITVIPNGVDLAGSRRHRRPARIRAEFGLTRDAYVIGVLGPAGPEQAFDLVIEAAAPLLGERTGCWSSAEQANRTRRELDAEAGPPGAWRR